MSDHLDAAPTVADRHAITVFSDIGCPWARVAIDRLVSTRARLGLDDTIAIDHRCFPLEFVNGTPTPHAPLEQAARACAELASHLEWSFEPDPFLFPVSTLAAMEAVQAAKAQGPEASVRLDLALRDAVFARWACVSVHSVVLAVAASVDGIDVDALWTEIASGRARAEIFHDNAVITTEEIPGSPTFVLGDGRMHFAPGIEHHVDADGVVVVDLDQPEVIEDLLARAVEQQPAD